MHPQFGFIVIVFFRCIRNFHVVMNLDGCDRLFSLQLFRTLPVGKIHRVPSGLCSLSIFFLLFYSTSSVYPISKAATSDPRGEERGSGASFS